jgi:SAM-dependent methyltransferase
LLTAQPEQNFWGEGIIEPFTMLRESFLEDSLQQGVQNIFKSLGVPDRELSPLIAALWENAEDENQVACDRRLQKLVLGLFDPKLIRNNLDQRAEHVASQIAPYVTGRSLLDVGCGDGMVSWNLRDRFSKFLLLDVINYLDARAALPFVEYREGSPLPVEEQYDSVIVTNVLHHAMDPLYLLDQCWQHTAKRLVIIESVYGDPNHNEPKLPFTLEPRSQFLYTSFFDWFYNRALHSDVPVPFNFAPPARWEYEFEQRGMKLFYKQDLGIDVDIVPIHHYLYVLER